MKKLINDSNLIKLLTILLICMVLVTETFAASSKSQGISTTTTDSYNILLLIDKSGSMNGTDRNRLALSAACQFVDQLCTTYRELSSVTNVSVIAFSKDQETISPFVCLNSEANTNYLKSEIRSIKYDKVNTGGTDLGTALNEAAECLKKQSNDDQKNMIVMFTDGYSENVRDVEQSEENLENAITIAGNLECEIFIVGLNQDNKITEQGQNEIYYIADTAQIDEGIEEKALNDPYAKGEKVNYLITDNIKNVRMFYGRIYAKMIGSIIEFVDNHKFSVLPGGVLEADVTVYSDVKIRKVEVLDPDGNVQKEDGETYFSSGDDYYKIIKIMMPKIGVWEVHVTTDDDSYMTYVVQFYGVEAAITATWDKAPENSGLDRDYAGKVIITPMYKGEKYQDSEWAKNVNGEFTVTAFDKKKTYDLEYFSDTKEFVGYFPVETGTYHIEGRLIGNSMKRTAECTLNVNIPDLFIGEEHLFPLENIYVKKGKTVDVDLDKITAIAGLVVQNTTVESALNGDDSATIVSAVNEKNILKITGQKDGNAKIVVEATDSKGNVWKITGEVIVEYAWSWYHYIMAAFLLIMILVAIAYWKGINEHVEGRFDVTVKISEQSERKYAGALKTWEISNYPKGKSFSLWRLIEKEVKILECLAKEDLESQEIYNQLIEEKRTLKSKKILIHGGKKGSRRNYKLQESGSGGKVKLKNDLFVTIKFVPLSGWNQDSDDGWVPIPNQRKANRVKK